MYDAINVLYLKTSKKNAHSDDAIVHTRMHTQNTQRSRRSGERRNVVCAPLLKEKCNKPQTQHISSINQPPATFYLCCCARSTTISCFLRLPTNSHRILCCVVWKLSPNQKCVLELQKYSACRSSLLLQLCCCLWFSPAAEL